MLEDEFRLCVVGGEDLIVRRSQDARLVNVIDLGTCQVLNSQWYLLGCLCSIGNQAMVLQILQTWNIDNISRFLSETELYIYLSNMSLCV
jgi:hypothetical protein